MCYALFTYEWRVYFLRKKQMGFWDDRVGPVTVAVAVFLTLFTILMIAGVDLFF
jgi:hypothetical protein